MTLPEPPAGESREVLQTVWDLAFGTGEWPTFAKLDRRWDSRHDSDVVDVLRQLPEGFTNGTDLRIQPQATTRIGLTVAGAAACTGAEEALATFLDFIRVATSAERGWQPPQGDPEAPPMVTDQSYASQAQGLPAAGRQHLLRLLFLLIHSEPSVWGSTSGPDADGHWYVTLGRRIRPFRNVTDLDGYWALRYKSWEPPAEAPAAGPLPEPFAEDVQRALLSAHPEVLAGALLEGIHTALRGSVTAIVAGEELEPRVDRAVAEEALRRLESQGHIRLLWVHAPPAMPDVMLTPTGAARAESTRIRWNTRVFRDRAARNALLAWLHDHQGTTQSPIPLDDFFRDPRSAPDGHFFSAADIDAAATYLNEKGLIGGIFIEEQRRPLMAGLTAEGIDCMEQGGDVAEHLTPRPGGVTYNFHGPISGTNVAVGDNATQHATVHSIDAENLRTLMQAMMEALPGLHMDTQDQKDAEETADVILAEIVEDHPNHPRVHAALTKIRNLLARAGNQALAAVLSAAFDYERIKLGLPPAGG